MRHFMMAMLKVAVVLLVSLYAVALLGGCGTVPGLWRSGAAPTVSIETSKPPIVMKELSVPSAPAPHPVSRSDADPAKAVSAFPGVSRLAPPMATGGGRFYRDALLSEDTVWSGEVVVEGSLTVAPQTTLTLEPGTVVRFRRTAQGEGAGPLLLVQGRLVARGSAEEPVRFTSAYPDPQAGEWEGINFLASEKKNILEQCTIEGAVAGVDASFSTVTLKHVSFAACGAGARFRDSIVTVSGGGASGCDIGMDLDESESDVREAVFRGNRLGMALRGGSLFLEGAHVVDSTETGFTAVATRLSITGAFFQGNGVGIVLRGCEGKVAAARIANNRDVGIHLVRSRVQLFGSDVSSNGSVGLRVDDGKGVAWGNAFSGNGRYDIDNGGSEDFRAVANWWGDPTPSLEMRLYHHAQDVARGRIFVNPVLRARPPLATLNSVAK